MTFTRHSAQTLLQKKLCSWNDETGNEQKWHSPSENDSISQCSLVPVHCRQQWF